MQSAPEVVSAQPRSVPIARTRCLGIAQIINGTIILFGIIALIALGNWVSYLGIGIGIGAWIIVGGIIGVFSAANPTNTCLNGFNVAFAIFFFLATMPGIIGCLLLAFHWPFLVIPTLVFAAEFAVSLCVMCCPNSCLASQPLQAAHIEPSSGYPMSDGMTAAYSAPVSYVNQGYTQAYTTAPPGGNPQMAYTTSAGQMQPAIPTAMTYNQPGGAEKQQESDAPPPYEDML